MRMSVHKHDRGYHKRACLYQAYLNKQTVDHCFTADEDRGYILRDKTKNGQVVLNEEKTEVLTEQLVGNVEIRLKK